MDLHELLQRNRVSLINGDPRMSVREARAHDQFAREYADQFPRTLSALRPGTCWKIPDVGHPATLIKEDGSVDRVIITDISNDGLGLAAASPPKIGECVVIRMAGCADLTVLIRWASGERAGGSFQLDTGENG